MPDPNETTPTVLRRLMAHIVELFQTYATLAGQETRATGRDLARGVLLLGAALLLGALALVMAVVMAVLLLTLVLRPWEAAAVVFALTGLAMVLCIELGIGRFRRQRLQKVVEAFREDMRWLRSELLRRD